MEFDEIVKLLSCEYRYARDNYIPIIRDESAKFLYNFVRDNNIKRVLEIGTAIGYSGSLMLSAGANNLTTIDINHDYLEMAKETFGKCGYIDRVEIIEGDAKVVLRQLIDRQDSYDMVFLDGAKGQYINYLPNLIKLLKVDGVIFADNVLLHGMVESEDKIPHRKRTMVVNLREYLKVVGQYPYETELIRIEDGIAITKYKGE